MALNAFSRMNALLLGVAVAGALPFISCNKANSNSSNQTGNSQFQVMLTDGPGNYDAVYIDIQKVEVNFSSDTGTSMGWQTVTLLRPGVYNLLKFRNGLDTVLAAGTFPAGTIQQIRLVLGDSNWVVLNGQSFPLKTPSAQQSGLKLNIDATLTPQIVYRLWLDFDANRSIVDAGNSGKFILKPVIRAFAAAVGGSIKGIVLPPAAKPEVFAVQGTDTLLALPDTTTGYYFLGGVAAGSWGLRIHALDTLYRDTAFTVQVATGAVTDAGTVTLLKK